MYVQIYLSVFVSVCLACCLPAWLSVCLSLNPPMCVPTPSYDAVRLQLNSQPRASQTVVLSKFSEGSSAYLVDMGVAQQNPQLKDP